MKECVLMTEEQFIIQAVNANFEKIGILEATRFLALKFESELDSVKWHQEWQAQLDKDAFFDDVFK